MWDHLANWYAGRSLVLLAESSEEDPGSPTHIVTVRGVGYRFEKPRAVAG